MAITAQKFLPPSKGQIVPAKSSNISKSISKVSSSSLGGEILKKNIDVITIKVIKIDDILKGTLSLEKRKLDLMKREDGERRKEKEEEKLEKKPQQMVGGIKSPQLPKLGFLDWIKNYISNVIMGYFAVRMIEHLPKLMPILQFLGKATDVAIDIGGKFLNGVATFVDWSYKAYDATRGFLKNLGGDNFVKVFEVFNGAVGTIIETLITASIVIASQGKGGLLDVGGEVAGDWIKKRFFQKAAQTAAQSGAQQLSLPGLGGTGGSTIGSATQGAGIGAGAVAGIVAGSGLLASALGEGAFQIRKFAIKPIQDLENKFNEDRNPITKIGRGIVLGMVRPLYGVFSAVGFLLDIVGAPFRYAIELLRFPFLNEEDKIKQANNLAKFDARIRDDLRKALNMVTLGLAFRERGSFGNIYGNKGAQKEMMSKMSGGGVTRGGKTQGTIKRTITKQKYKRTITQKPGKIKITSPGSDVGGEEKILGLFPNPSKGKQDTQGKKRNPYQVIENAGKNLGDSDYFGPILAITSKILLGQEPDQQDYKNVGLGINLLVAKGIERGNLRGGLIPAFAEGGFVDSQSFDAINSSGNITDWVAKSFKEATETNAQKTLREIRQNLRLKALEVQKSKEVSEPSPGEELGNATEMIGGARLFMDLGFPPLAAAILAGNVQQESGWKGQRTPWVLNDGAGTNKGLISWNRTRITNAERFLGKPLETASNAEQVKWIKEELKQYGLLDEFMNPNRTESQLKEDAYKYIGWGDVGDRWKYSSQIYAALQKGETGSYVPSASPSGIELGKGYGSGGSKIAGDLGDFIKAATGLPWKEVHRHPRHPPWDAESGHSPGSLHYRSKGARAIDLGGNWPGDQLPLLKKIEEFNKSRGVKPVQLFYGKPGTPEWQSHTDHVHVAYKRGGKVKGKMGIDQIRAMLTHGEFVIDVDSTAALEKNFPGFLDAINKANYDGAINVLRSYASYEVQSQEPEVVFVPVPVNNVINSDRMGDSSSFVAASGSNPFDILYRG